MLKLIFLGTGSAVPSPTRACTSHLLLETESNQMIMVDTGSCMARNFFPYMHYWNCPLDIFITHMHPDHWVGLLEFLPIFSILGRTEEVNVWCGKETVEMLDTIFTTPMYSKTPFPLMTRVIDENYVWRKDITRGEIKTTACQADHSVPTLALRFDIKVREGNQNEARKFSIGFGADSRPVGYLNSFLYKVDYLIWEATYLHSLQHLAIKSKHSTSMEAGQFAKDAQVKMLFMNHISYHTNPNLQLAEAQEIFTQTMIPEDGQIITFNERGWNFDKLSVDAEKAAYAELAKAMKLKSIEQLMKMANNEYTNMFPPPSSY